jgi:hypothetical protein
LRPLTDASGRERAHHAGHSKAIQREITDMFLTAVLQAHTDSVASADHDSPTPQSPLDDTSTSLKRLEEALAVPAQERLQSLPAAHRSRWV